ncbi:hypothetical protein Cni_G14571 [Canna indica]|uniref:Uncharacterized protein n=1 Tax=Canna indica TaxID=4628 RepID=A0AAQ3KEF7_9LILI|nr:hypothetical protein Cni_G14571 [Canna indica]
MANHHLQDSRSWICSHVSCFTSIAPARSEAFPSEKARECLKEMHGKRTGNGPRLHVGRMDETIFLARLEKVTGGSLVIGKGKSPLVDDSPAPLLLKLSQALGSRALGASGSQATERKRVKASCVGEGLPLCSLFYGRG